MPEPEKHWLWKEADYGLCYQLTDPGHILKKAKEILANPDNGAVYKERAQRLLSEKKDPTQFMVWFVENWPESKQVMAVERGV